MRTLKDLIGKQEFVITGTDDELLQAEELLLKNGAKNDDPEYNDRNRCDGFENAIGVFSDSSYVYLLKDFAIMGICNENIFTFSEFLQLIPE